MSAKNLGQIAGLHIGSTPPNNTTLIWFDDTPAIRRHKVYDFATSQWIVLEKSIITSITYSELTNKAQGTGLSVGEYFMITDKANALALAITRTKVQYTDIQGNILIDDLGTNIVYHVNSSNLLIDDINGVYDEETSTLVFRFTEIDTPEQDDYILAKGQRKSDGSSVWQFLKFKISNFISKKTGNSLKWDGGLFLDVMEQIEDSEDTPTGVVSMKTFTEKVNTLETSINNVGKENQSIINTANRNIQSATTPTAIYSKRLPTAPTAATATDIVKGDTLTTIVNKIQRWITQFKIATGIKVSRDFAANGSDFNINNNDTVDSALRKVQGNMQNYRKGLSDFKTEWDEYQEVINEEVQNANSRQGDTILVSAGTGTTAITPTEVTEESHNITFGENLKSAFQKLLYMCTQIQGWQINSGTITGDKIVSKGAGIMQTNIIDVTLGTSITNPIDFSDWDFAISVELGLGGGWGVLKDNRTYPYNSRDLTIGFLPYGKLHKGADESTGSQSARYNFYQSVPCIDFTQMAPSNQNLIVTVIVVPPINYSYNTELYSSNVRLGSYIGTGEVRKDFSKTDLIGTNEANKFQVSFSSTEWGSIKNQSGHGIYITLNIERTDR